MRSVKYLSPEEVSQAFGVAFSRTSGNSYLIYVKDVGNLSYDISCYGNPAYSFTLREVDGTLLLHCVFDPTRESLLSNFFEDTGEDVVKYFVTSILKLIGPGLMFDKLNSDFKNALSSHEVALTLSGIPL